MTAKQATATLKAGTLIDDDEPLKISKRAALRATNDINKLPTHEILRRVYMRHQTGLWQLATVATWAVIAYKVFWA